MEKDLAIIAKAATIRERTNSVMVATVALRCYKEATNRIYKNNGHSGKILYAIWRASHIIV